MIHRKGPANGDVCKDLHTRIVSKDIMSIEHVASQEGWIKRTRSSFG